MRSALILFGLLACTGDDTDPSVEIPDDLDAVTSAARPSKRSEVRTAAHAATNTILIFGGQDGPVVNQFPTSRFLNDTWVYEPGAGWVEVQTDQRPRRRSRYSIAVDETGNRALLFGGRFRQDGNSGDYTLYNDLWSFDFLTRQWTQLDDGSGVAPPARYYGQGAWDASTQTFYVWGGNLNANPLTFVVTDDLWAWTAAGGWREVPTTGNAPSPRSFLNSAHDTARNELIIFGGQVGNLSDLAYNDTYALNLDTYAWRRLHNGARDEAPSTRMLAPLVYDDLRDRYVLFGGHTDVGDQNDVWAFDPDDRTWSEVYIADVLNGGLGCLGNPSEVPETYVTMDLAAPERRHNGMVALLHDSLWIFGGWHAECSDHLDDTWRYDLESNTWHELLEARSGESCLRAGEDCECLCL